MRDIWRRISRIYHRSEWWVGRCFAYALRGIVSRTQNWALAGGGIVGFAFDALGFKMTPLEGWQGALVSGAAGIGAAWAILVVARLLLAPFRMWRGGKWYEREFVYDEPRLAIAIRASQDTNNFIHHFRFPDAPPFALIKYTIERATPYLDHVQVHVHPHWRGIPTMNADILLTAN